MPAFLSFCRFVAIATLVAATTHNAQVARADEEGMQAAFKQAKKFENQGNWDAAVRYYERAAAEAPSGSATDADNLASILNNLALMYSNQGQFSKAASAYTRSLKIYERENGPNHLRVALSLNNLGVLYNELGQYAKAEPMFQRSLQIRRAKLGPNHSDVGAVLNNLATLYHTIGQYAKAEPLYVRSLKIKETTLGVDHVDVASILNNLATIYKATEQYDKAAPMYKRSLRIREAKLGSTHPAVAEILQNLATLYHAQENYAQAEPLYARSLKINLARVGADHPDIARALSNLAVLYGDMQQHAKAAPLQARALKINEQKFGMNHFEVSRNLSNVAVLDVALGDPASAALRFERSRRIVRRHVAQVLPILTDTEQLTFLDKVDRTKLEMALSLALHRPSDVAIAELSAGWLANGKAVAQATLAERAQLARDTSDPRLAGAASELQNVRAELAKLAMAGAKPGQDSVQQSQLASLTAREQSLAKEIAAARGQATPSDAWVATSAIRAALPVDAVLVDIARIEVKQFAEAKNPRTGKPTKQDWLAPRYVAWIVPSAGRGDVQAIDLGEADQIDAAVESYQTAMAAAQTGKPLRTLGEAGAADELAKPLAALAKLVLAPVAPHLAHAKQLVLSPDASLWLVPWAALPVGDDKFAIEQWQIRYVVAGREVALEKLRTSAPIKSTPPRLFANPAYDLPLREAMLAYQAIFDPRAKFTTSAPQGKPGVELLAMRSASQFGRVRPLPGTAIEAASVAPKLRLYTQSEPKSYLDRQAQEGVFKRLTSPQVLLMSTHGFFLPDRKVKRDDKTSDLRDAGHESSAASASSEAGATGQDNPLLRCGLMLAGCNQYQSKADAELAKNFDDGILTGLEIVGANLRGTELVVLSACETGLGVVNNGEGVAGLRQAFQLAGARSVVSTLWQIPDRESAQLMTTFFTNLANGQTKAEALRNAQLTMIEARRERHGAAHPMFWAAFAVTGN